MPFENLQRVSRNVQKLREQNASEAEVAQYLGGEGFTPQRFEQSMQLLERSGEQRPQHGFGQQMLQGTTFGFADEIASGARAMTGRGTFDENMAARQLAREDYVQNNPGRAMAAELAGTAPLLAVPFLGKGAMARTAGATGLSQLAANAPRTARFGAAAAGGAAGGALYGAGAADPGERAEGAAEGATIGAVTGPLFQGAVDLAAPLARQIPGLRSPERPQQQADDILRRRMDQDNMTPEQLREAAQRMDARPETIMELSGENVMRLGDQAALFPGDSARMARELAEMRRSGQADRVIADLESAFGTRSSVSEVVGPLQEKMRREAAPLYDRAYQAGGRIVDPEVLNMLRLPAFNQAYNRARRIATYEGAELPPRLFDNDGNLTVDALDLRTLDLIKRGLDDVLYTGRQPGSGIGATERGAIERARGEFVSRLDELVPEYAQARAAWAGPAQTLESIDLGRQALRLRPEDIAEQVQSMSPSELGAYRFGALDELRFQVLNAADGRDAYRIVFGSPVKRERLRTLVGEAEFEQLQTQMRREAAIRRTDDTIRGGSQTAQRQLGADDLGSADMLSQIANQGLVSTAFNAVRRRLSVGQGTADALAPTLFSTDPRVMMEAATRLEQVPGQRAQRALTPAMQLAPGAAGAQIMQE